MDEKVEHALQFIEEQLAIYPEHKIATISSWGKDSIVLVWLVRQVNPKLPILWVKPPFLPKETIELAKIVKEKWNLNVIEVESDFIKDEQYMNDLVYKPKIWKTAPEICCSWFKDEPMFKKVREMGLKAWFSGLRGTESEKRKMFTMEWKQGEFTKLHPLLNWTEADIWRITASFDLPVNPLYRNGYRSLGCINCSFPNVWSSERGGRWTDTALEGLECGLHCLPPFFQGNIANGIRKDLGIDDQ